MEDARRLWREALEVMPLESNPYHQKAARELGK